MDVRYFNGLLNIDRSTLGQYLGKEYAHLGATWPMMRQHVYVIADTMTTALAKQFPSKFS